MSKMTIVIAEEDVNYLSPLEIKFVEELGDLADIVTITDKEYLAEYFSIPRKIDVLLINKELYSDSFVKHDIESVFILNEDESSGGENEIYKYTSVKDIYDVVIGNVRLDEKTTQEKKHTEIIMTYSPIGGAGTTTFSLVFARAIAKKNKNVLFLSSENIQSAAAYINSERTMTKGLEKSISTMSDDLLQKLSEESFVIDGVVYVPPIKQATTVLGIKDDHFISLLKRLKKQNKYDYIVLDSDSDLSPEKCTMMALADKVAIIVTQDLVAVKKLDIFLENIDCSNLEKFMFVCNKYRSSRENNLTNQTMKNNCIIKQYIEYCYDNINLNEIAQNDAIQNFVYSLL